MQEVLAQSPLEVIRFIPRVAKAAAEQRATSKKNVLYFSTDSAVTFPAVHEIDNKSAEIG